MRVRYLLQPLLLLQGERPRQAFSGEEANKSEAHVNLSPRSISSMSMDGLKPRRTQDQYMVRV